MLEQLELEHELVPYQRNHDYHAPEEVRKIHSLGRIPLVDLEDRSSGGKKLLAESGYIFHYIQEHFDTEGPLSSNSFEDAEKIE